jgi:hypothetical protein
LSACGSPSIDGHAFLVSTDIAALLADGHASADASSQVIPVTVPAGAGIRDLATLPDGHLLLLIGPAQNQDIPYSLVRLDLHSPTNGETLAKLAKVTEGGKTGKAEAITVLNYTSTELEVFVLFDGLKNGGPRKYRISLQ